MARISFTTMGTPDKDGFEAIAAATKYGYAGVDLRVHEHKGEILPDSPDDHIAALKQCLREHNVAVPSLLCYNKTGNLEDGSWETMHDDICLHMAIAKKLGAEGIRIFGGPIDKYTSPEAYIEESAKVLRRVLDHDDSDVRIVLQNHGGSYTFAQGIELTKLTDRPRFGMCFSPDHCRLMKEDWDYALVNAKQYSLQMYCSDVKWNADGSHHGALPGEGDVDLIAAFKALGGNEFDGWVSFKWEKIWQNQLQEPEVALPHFVKYYSEKMLI
jgi:sugar phosphate isomerase/epimerase